MPSLGEYDTPHTEGDIDDRDNEVLQFLLGKTTSIPSDDTSSVASTSSSLSASLGECPFDDSAALPGSLLRHAYAVAEWPLPDPSTLYTPWDVSNVKAQIVYPEDGMDVYSPLQITGQLIDFPTESIRRYGVETFEYRFLLDGRMIYHEVDFWSRAEAFSQDIDTLKRVFQHRLDVSALAYHQPTDHELRLEVTFTVPGSDAETKQLSDSVRFRVVQPTSGRSLVITAPEQDATFLNPIPGGFATP
ncbi:hypothetical protein P43SY_012009 [Pythium insidiosum]|uniref:Uncharacterized protein n=1 Tax=Pythium insidiosum TaxID=114742 RepID=A0AAD5Q0W5_PYTIN|nr:hypothetical protein P43SY_012009 [Pythium insidiosum]